MAEKPGPERRLAAILAADVAGYSRLMGADEEGTLERLKALRRDLVEPKVAEHHGRIVKVTGDGVLVAFSSVVDAVRCAVEVQHAMAERNVDVPPDRLQRFERPLLVGPHQPRIARDIGGNDRGEPAGLAHIASPAARRRPERKSSRCSWLRKWSVLGMIVAVMERSRATISLASSSRPIWA